MYFGIIVYKNADNCSDVLKETKKFQHMVNALCKKSLKFSLNPLEGEESEEE